MVILLTPGESSNHVLTRVAGAGLFFTFPAPAHGKFRLRLLVETCDFIYFSKLE